MLLKGCSERQRNLRRLQTAGAFMAANKGNSKKLERERKARYEEKRKAQTRGYLLRIPAGSTKEQIDALILSFNCRVNASQQGDKK